MSNCSGRSEAVVAFTSYMHIWPPVLLMGIAHSGISPTGRDIEQTDVVAPLFAQLASRKNILGSIANCGVGTEAVVVVISQTHILRPIVLCYWG